MHFSRCIVVSLLILAISPLVAHSQGPMTPPPSTAESPSAYQNSSDGLRWQLQDILNAARDPNKSRLDSLVRQMEIPNYQNWFIKNFGEEAGGNMSMNYGRNFADGDTYLETLFTQLASEDGEFTIHKVTLGDEGGGPGGTVPPRGEWKSPANPFTVTWKTKGISGPPQFRGIGAFVFLDGTFRLVAVSRTPKFAPGTSTYPSLSPIPPAGKVADTGGDPPVGGNDQDTYHAGIGGVGFPRCTYCPSPEYTKEARKKRLEGTVVLQVTVLPSGQASDIVIVTTVDTGLSQKAVEAVSKWRFSPAHRSDGQAVPVRVPIEVTFRMLN